MKNFDQLYTQAANGDLVPRPHLASAISRQYQRLGLSAPGTPASSTPERGRAFDAAPAPAQRPKKTLVDLLIALREFRDRRAARAMDAVVAPRADYSGLQRAYDSRRGMPVGSVPVESAAPVAEAVDERMEAFRRDQFRAAHCMYSASEHQVAQYADLQRHYDAQRAAE